MGTIEIEINMVAMTLIWHNWVLFKIIQTLLLMLLNDFMLITLSTVAILECLHEEQLFGESFLLIQIKLAL